MSGLPSVASAASGAPTDAHLTAHRCSPRAGVRPVPLEIHIQGFEIVNLEARMQVRWELMGMECAAAWSCDRR